MGIQKEQYDVIIISGDAYVDHPYFGTAVIKRFLESKGFSVAVIAQPDWKTDKDFLQFGAPRLFFGVTAGNMDSMLANYTPLKKPRDTDSYSPRCAPGKRPDRATTVYCNKLKALFKGQTNINGEPIPIILGGIEASLRRFAHYDYWSNSIRRSILSDTRADLVVYGMGEHAAAEIAEAIRSGKKVSNLKGIKNTCYKSEELPEGCKVMPAFDAICGEDDNSKTLFADAFRIFYDNECVAQKQDSNSKLYVVQNPMKTLSTAELDAIYELPFTRQANIPAIESVKFSVLSHRGCFGKCSFCALFFHQGKIIQSRSPASIKKEIESLRKHPGFHGVIDDLGGPSANMYAMDCKVACKDSRKSCIDCPVTARKYDDLFIYLQVLDDAASVNGIKKVCVRSGLRLDLINRLQGKSEEYLYRLCRTHISGRLKVAPEHVNDAVLRLMNKGTAEDFRRFLRTFRQVQARLKSEGVNIQLIPYFMAAHPGCSLNEMDDLKAFIEKNGETDQVQLFTPTPGTLSSCMYWTGIHPLTGERIYVAHTYNEKKMQKAMMHPTRIENRQRLNTRRR